MNLKISSTYVVETVYSSTHGGGGSAVDGGAKQRQTSYAIDLLFSYYRRRRSFSGRNNIDVIRRGYTLSFLFLQASFSRLSTTVKKKGGKKGENAQKLIRRSVSSPCLIQTAPIQQRIPLSTMKKKNILQPRMYPELLLKPVPLSSDSNPTNIHSSFFPLTFYHPGRQRSFDPSLALPLSLRVIFPLTVFGPPRFAFNCDILNTP
jgi:hypothetical protein